MSVKYVKSKIFNCYYYQCLKCGLDLKPDWLELVASTNCKCGQKITSSDIISAKNDYISKLESKNQRLIEKIQNYRNTEEFKNMKFSAGLNENGILYVQYREVINNIREAIETLLTEIESEDL